MVALIERAAKVRMNDGDYLADVKPGWRRAAIGAGGPVAEASLGQYAADALCLSVWRGKLGPPQLGAPAVFGVCPRSQKRNARAAAKAERAAKRLAKKGGKQDKWTAQIALDSTPHKARWQAGDENAGWDLRGARRRRRARGAAERARAVFDGAAAAADGVGVGVGIQSLWIDPRLSTRPNKQSAQARHERSSPRSRSARRRALSQSTQHSLLKMLGGLSPRRHHLPARPALRPRRRRVGAALVGSILVPSSSGAARRRDRSTRVEAKGANVAPRTRLDTPHSSAPAAATPMEVVGSPPQAMEVEGDVLR